MPFCFIAPIFDDDNGRLSARFIRRITGGLLVRGALPLCTTLPACPPSGWEVLFN